MRSVRTFIALACAALLFACAPPPANPALWRLADSDSEVFLFGTVHVLPKKLRWKSARVSEAFARADTVWFETATDDAAGAVIAEIVAREGINPPGVSLSSQIAPADRARLVRVAGDLGVPLESLERMRPWVAALQLSLATLTRQGQSADAGVERVLEADAAAQGKRVAYFETAAEQMAIFTDLSPEAQAQFLSSTLRQIEEEAGAGAAMAQLWANGEAGKLGALVADMLEEAGPETADAMLYRRNEAWTAKIEEMMADKGVAFVAVGAAHMSGPRGLPALLRARGYTVEGPS